MEERVEIKIDLDRDEKTVNLHSNVNDYRKSNGAHNIHFPFRTRFSR